VEHHSARGPTSRSHLFSWGVQSKQLRVSAALPRLLVEAVQLLVAAVGQQAFHSPVRGQAAQVKVGGGQSAARVVTQPRECWRRDLGQRQRQRVRGCSWGEDRDNRERGRRNKNKGWAKKREVLKQNIQKDVMKRDIDEIGCRVWDTIWMDIRTKPGLPSAKLLHYGVWVNGIKAHSTSPLNCCPMAKSKINTQTKNVPPQMINCILPQHLMNRRQHRVHWKRHDKRRTGIHAVWRRFPLWPGDNESLPCVWASSRLPPCREHAADRSWLCSLNVWCDREWRDASPTITLPFKSLGSPRQFRVFHEKSHFYLSNEYKM